MRQFDAPNPPPRLPAEPIAVVADAPLASALATYNQWLVLIRAVLVLYVLCLLIFKRRTKPHFE